jgi:hypothetical protein
MKVKNLEIDLSNFDEKKMQAHNYLDIEVLHEYIDDYHYEIIIRRLDNNGKGGWSEDLFILINYISLKKTETINIGKESESEKRIIIETKEKIEDSREENIYSPVYLLPNIPEPIAISRIEFNYLFETDIVVLPSNLYAFGILKDKDQDQDQTKIYIYNECYEMYYEIIFNANLLLKVIAMCNDLSKYYFIICSYDGYPEYQYMNIHEKTPKYIGENECEKIPKINKNFKLESEINSRLFLNSEIEYPIFYSKKIIFAQSAMKYIPNIIPIIDRHYLFCNLYKTYRSIHRGIPFSQKKNKIIFGCRKSNGSKFNFVERRDIEINQRSYFYSDFCDKRNVVYQEDGWITEAEMVNYKYILNIDGNACTWDATAWKLNSGSVIFKVDAPWIQWFYPEYLPYIHYIPIKDDMSDLQDKYQWCEKHPEECEKIVENSKKLFQKIYRMNNIIKYIQSIL